MKIVQFIDQNETRLGVKTDQGILDVKSAVETFNFTAPTHLQDLFDQGEDGRSKLNDLVINVLSEESKDLFLSEEDLQFASAVSHPEKIICVGLNYLRHANESQLDIPEVPLLFSKFSNALAAHLDEISIPKEAERMDYEAELVIVIGKAAKNVSKEDALSYVFGYTLGNDLSARDLQFKTAQWLLGKSPDGFAPVGPYITTQEEIDPQNLNVECKVNGEVRQSGNTKDMIFDCATIISYVSQTMTLKPGDLIFTGTPEGVILGYPEDQQEWLKPGDEMVVSIESLGELKNKLI